MILVQLPFVAGIYSQLVKHVNYIDCVASKLKLSILKLGFFFSNVQLVICKNVSYFQNLNL